MSEPANVCPYCSATHHGAGCEFLAPRPTEPERLPVLYLDDRCELLDDLPSEPPTEPTPETSAEPQPCTPEEVRGECYHTTLRKYADQCEELDQQRYGSSYEAALRENNGLREELERVRKERDWLAQVSAAWTLWYEKLQTIAGDLHPKAVVYAGRDTLLDMLGSGIARLRERIAELENQVATLDQQLREERE